MTAKMSVMKATNQLVLVHPLAMSQIQHLLDSQIIYSHKAAIYVDDDKGNVMSGMERWSRW